MVPTSAFAHAHLIRANLAPDQTIYVPAGVVHFWFDEALNPALTRAIIRNAQGTQVNSDTGRVDTGNAAELDMRVPALAPGQYTVLWTSDSAQDGHVLHSFYVFTAGGSGAAAIGTVNEAVDDTGNPGLDGASMFTSLSRFLVLLTAALWTGALIVLLLVLRPAWARADWKDRAFLERGLAAIGRIVRLSLTGSLSPRCWN